MSYFPTGNSAIEAVLRRVMDFAWWGKYVADRAIPPICLNNENITGLNAATTGVIGLLKVNTSDLAEAPTGINLANATKLTGTDSAGGFRDIAKLDASDNLYLGGGFAVQPTLQPAVYTMAANAALADQPFFNANQVYRVMKIQEVHGTAGNDAGAVTAVIRKCTSGQTVIQGTALMSSTFDMKGTANTVQTATLAASIATLTLAAGDRLAIDYTGTLTTLANVCVTVWLLPTSATLDISFAWNANAGLVDAAFFVANDRYRVSAITYSHTTLGTDAGAVNVQVVKDTSTNAPGAGTDLLTNNANAGFNCKSTINVPQTGTLTATAASLELAVGDRLSVDFAGTTTALAGLVITVSLTPISGRLEIPFYIPGAPAAATDQAFLIADRDYIAVASSEVHAVAAGGVSTAQLVRDTGTDAPGAGSDLLTAADNLNSTANTVVTNLLVTTLGLTRIRAGDRLSYDFANAIQSTSGPCVTASLKAA